MNTHTSPTSYTPEVPGVPPEIGHETSREATDIPQKKTPSKAMTVLKNGFDSMTAPVTRPVKNVMSKVRARTMGIA